MTLSTEIRAIRYARRRLMQAARQASQINTARARSLVLDARDTNRDLVKLLAMRGVS